jgi:CheY-like chemotaxis protein
MESGLRAHELFSRAAASGRSPFDLVIMDMLLGESLDGLEVIDARPDGAEGPARRSRTPVAGH